VDKLAQHGLTTEDFEMVLANPEELSRSRSSGRNIAIGYTEDGRRIICVYEEIDDLYVEPCTACEIED
jgi:uncharacterized DUF497 family protein